jgi:AAA domain
VIPMPVNFRDASFQQELLAIGVEMHPILIIVGTLSRCTPGAEENSARDMGEVIAFCSELQKPSSAAIAFVHHPTKADPKGGGRGSSVVFGAVDTEIRITTDDDDADVIGSRLITVTCAKQKDDLKPPALNLAGCVVSVHDLDGREMAHESGRPITSLVLRLADRGDAVGKAVEKAAAADYATDLQVLRTMVDYPAATNQKKLRDYAALNQGVVNDSIAFCGLGGPLKASAGSLT